MAIIRDALRRLSRPANAQPAAPDRADYSYRVYWTKQVRDWDAIRRRSILLAARLVAASEAFEPNAFERRSRVEGVDGEHSGASVLALIQVLEAFDAAV